MLLRKNLTINKGCFLTAYKINSNNIIVRCTGTNKD